MISEAKYHVIVWSMQMQGMMGKMFGNLDPQMYSIGAVFVICVGFVLLSGRR